MLFNSYQFIAIYLPIVLVGFFFLARRRMIGMALGWLFISSLAFYAYWDPRYLILLLVSIFANYLFGNLIARHLEQREKARLFMILAVSANLAALAYFKYTGFAFRTLNHLPGAHFPVPEIVLPLGISFFTFTQIAYLVDVYRGEITNYEPLGYAVFVTFFPHLIAGPILHHKSIIPQFHRLRNYVFSGKNFALGLFVFAVGLAKKVLIADNIGSWANVVFDHANSVNTLEAWVGALAYTFQLFYDFSGYSDMAVGLGLMLNICLPINFDVPYQSTSIIDFWRRWHITLSAFLRDYLYIPLGGNRFGEFRRYVNLIATMLLGGLWHGAGWTFFVWGALHGAYLATNHLWRRLKLQLYAPVAWTATFLATVVAWVFFRAQRLPDALNILGAMFNFQAVFSSYPLRLFLLLPVPSTPLAIPHENYLIGGKKSLIALVLLMASIWIIPSIRVSMARFKPTLGYAVITAALLLFSMLSMNRVAQFLYFQF